MPHNAYKMKLRTKSENSEATMMLNGKGWKRFAAAFATTALACSLGCSAPATAMSAGNMKTVRKLAAKAKKKYGRKRTVRGEGERWAAHRGFSGLAPENTEAAIELAGMCGADAVEVDVRMTKDGKLILMHDSTVNRMTDGKGKVREMTFREISRLKVDGGSNAKRFKGLKVCTFSKCLKTCRKYGMSVYIELKTERRKKARKQIVRKTYRTLKKYGMLDKCMVISFSLNILKEWKKVDGKRRTATRPIFRDGISAKKRRAVRRKYSSGPTPDEMRGLSMADSPPKLKKS